MALIVHTFIGGPPTTRYSAPLTAEEAYRLIGANVMSAYTPILHTRTGTGSRLTTRDNGEPMSVTALHDPNGSVMSVIFFERM
ncbi:hypothetical protein [Streptomyces xanthochromogenes]